MDSTNGYPTPEVSLTEASSTPLLEADSAVVGQTSLTDTSSEIDDEM